MDVHEPPRVGGDDGYSLAGLLMMVVILGVLMAAAVVGVSSLTGGSDTTVIRTVTSSTSRHVTPTTGRGGAAGLGVGSGGGVSSLSACKASADAASSASTLYFANSGGAYPVKWSDMTSAQPPLFALATNVIINPAKPTELEGRGWTMVMAGGGSRAPTFTCGS